MVQRHTKGLIEVWFTTYHLAPRRNNDKQAKHLQSYLSQVHSRNMRHKFPSHQGNKHMDVQHANDLDMGVFSDDRILALHYPRNSSND